ncbi:MAG: hypothetical protein K9N52_03235 [Verrucomicrobia bacterium]|nr:hypothetical protein [Verrucomicrobiota bacterium]
MKFSKPLLRISCSSFASRYEELETAFRKREQAAYEKGCLDGERTLSEQLVKQRAELLELQNGLLNSLSQAVVKLVRDAEPMLAQLALELAGKLVGGLPVSAELVEANVREAIGQVEEDTEYKVCINREDIELLRRANSPLLLPEDKSSRIRFEPDPDIPRGGCMIITKFGVIDARLETKVNMIKKALQA